VFPKIQADFGFDKNKFCNGKTICLSELRYGFSDRRIVFSVALLEGKSGAKVLQSRGIKFVLSVKTRFAKKYPAINAIERKNYHLWQLIRNIQRTRVFHL
jgi:hypothetical protein